jgi:hypothetical protein
LFRPSTSSCATKQEDKTWITGTSPVMTIHPYFFFPAPAGHAPTRTASIVFSEVVR